MLACVKLGVIDTATRPDLRSIVSRPEWEFLACLNGKQSMTLAEGSAGNQFHERLLWACPRGFLHGWASQGPCERAVFHFTSAPRELEENVPARGYYRTVLSDSDCNRIRILAQTAESIIAAPTTLQGLRSSHLVSELSLLSLGEVPPRPLSIRDKARDKVKAALEWYADHMHQRPSYDDVSRSVAVSPSYLRQLFYDALNENPHQAMTRVRMERVAELLYSSELNLEDIAYQVGLSCGSALTRAVKAYYGTTPKHLRARKILANRVTRKNFSSN